MKTAFNAWKLNKVKTFLTAGFYLCRVEDRNDQKIQKMRRYVEAFSKEDEKQKEGWEKTDTTKEFSGIPLIEPNNSSGFSNKGSLTGWDMIRHGVLGLDIEQKEL